jgi:hypothetical protein
VGVELHRPPRSLVHAPVRLAAHVPDLPRHLALRQRPPPRMRQLFIAFVADMMTIIIFRLRRTGSDPYVRTW